MSIGRHTFSLVLMLWILLFSQGYGQSTGGTDVSLEELLHVKVYSVSKKSEDPRKSASSVYVITNNDLRQMGATHWVEALRTVPGLHVARMNGNKWMVSSRGFSEQFSNKLLVLIDGRVVYSPIFSGVYWDQQDLPIDTIKQIEVIRGPGATIWGANAVNGVINVITYSAGEMQGTIASVTTNGNNTNILEASHGDAISNGDFYRTYAKLSKTQDFDGRTTQHYKDGIQMGRAGFKYESQLNSLDGIQIHGDVYAGSEKQFYSLPTTSSPFTVRDEGTEKFHGANLMTKWQHSVSEKADLNVQSYLDYTMRDFRVSRASLGIADVDVQLDLQASDMHALSFGAGYRFIYDSIKNTPYLIYTPEERRTHVATGFVQDEITLIPNTLFLNMGVKVEHNSYSGFEYQPNTKLSWQIDNENMIWAGASKALRTPSRGTHDLSLQAVGRASGYISRVGNKRFQSEELVAYELGYKTSMLDNTQVDLTAFVNRYDKLRTFELGPSLGINNVAFPFNISNNGQANVHGIEANVRYNFDMMNWMEMGYTYFRPNLTLDGNAVDRVFLSDEGRTPKRQFSIRSSNLISEGITLNNALYHVGELSSLGIRSYFKYDANITFDIENGTELSVIGSNLLDKNHQEFTAPPLRGCC